MVEEISHCSSSETVPREDNTICESGPIEDAPYRSDSHEGVAVDPNCNLGVMTCCDEHRTCCLCRKRERNRSDTSICRECAIEGWGLDVVEESERLYNSRDVSLDDSHTGKYGYGVARVKLYGPFIPVPVEGADSR